MRRSREKTDSESKNCDSSSEGEVTGSPAKKKSAKGDTHVNGINGTDSDRNSEVSSCSADVEMEDCNSDKNATASPAHSNACKDKKNDKSVPKSVGSDKSKISPGKKTSKADKDISEDEAEKCVDNKARTLTNKNIKKKILNIDDDEDSTDLDEDKRNIREAERALRSLSGEWDGQGPFFSYENSNQNFNDTL